MIEGIVNKEGKFKLVDGLNYKLMVFNVFFRFKYCNI